MRRRKRGGDDLSVFVLATNFTIKKLNLTLFLFPFRSQWICNSESKQNSSEDKTKVICVAEYYHASFMRKCNKTACSIIESAH